MIIVPETWLVRMVYGGGRISQSGLSVPNFLFGKQLIFPLWEGIDKVFPLRKGFDRSLERKS